MPQDKNNHPLLQALAEILGGSRPLSGALAEMIANVPEKSAYPTQERQERSPSATIIDPNFRRGKPYVTWEFPHTMAGGKYAAESVGVTKNPEGIRFYRGQASNTDEDLASALASLMVQRKMASGSPDSVQSILAKQLLGAGGFSQILGELRRNPDYLNTKQSPL